MPDIEKPNMPPSATVADVLKSWVMVILTLLFVLLYAGALISFMLYDNTRIPETIKDLQPIVFVIIGYYFGRLPAQQNEGSLKEQIVQAAAKTDEANKAKENAIKNKAAIEGKMEIVKTTLAKVNEKFANDGGTETADAHHKAIEAIITAMNS